MTQKNQPEETRLESADEILRALEARKARKTQPAAPPRPPATGAAAAPAIAAAVPDARHQRPTARPPMALLCVLDDGPLDGKLDGEWHRLRVDRTVLGRGGTVSIPNDGQMSGEHAEVAREWGPSGWRWVLRDLGSTNGTYVRVGSTVLKHEAEIAVGLGRYRFEAANPPPTGLALAGTVMPQPLGGGLRGLVPSLVELSPDGPLQRHPLSLPEYWVGRDAGPGAIARPDDPYADAQHVRLHREKNGQWYATNNASLNGLWLRVNAISLERACQFRLGEQRFLFRTV